MIVSYHFSRRLSMLALIVRGCLACMLVCMFSGQSLATERVYLDITASEVRKTVVAVPYFTSDEGGNRQTGVEIAQLIEQAFDLYGYLDVKKAQRYGGGQDVDWESMEVDYVIIGSFSKTPQGLTIRGALRDVTGKRLLDGHLLSGALRQQDDMALRLADSLIEDFTGTPGISRTSIAYISDKTGRKEVYVSDILGRKHRQITKHRHLCVSPVFTPDGNHLAYSSYHRGNQDLYITDLRQNKVTRSLSRRRGLNLSPTFSPDGKHMVMTLSKDGSPDLYLMNRRGEILQRLTSRSGINVSARYSPDGKRLIFVSDRSGKPQIYTMDLITGTVTRLTSQHPENSEPAWSPDGRMIAFTGLKDGLYQIFTMTEDGKNIQQISSGWGEFESPSWSPDGKQLVFARKRNGHSELCIMEKNGKGLRVLFRLKGNQMYPQWSPQPQM